jgi:hypothetical protein
MSNVVLTTGAKTLVRSSFFGKDFETYVNELVDFMRVQYGLEVTSNLTQPGSQGQILIEMMAFALSTMSWYGDRQADDTNLRDVRIRTAAVTIARQIGYKAAAAIPAAVTLTLTLDFPPSTTRLTIEKGRKLIGPGGLIFESAEEVIFDVGSIGPKTFTAREGTTIEEIFTSDGTPNQFFLLETLSDSASIAQSTVQVFVNAIEWFESELLTYEQTNQFEVFYGLNPPRLQFGDGSAGNIPINGAEIRVLYLSTRGTGGAVPASSVLAFQEPLVAGTQTVTGTLSQPEPSTTGADPESISSIKTQAPLVFQTAQRAVTQTDYDALINAFVDPVYGAVAIGRATVPRSIEQDALALTIVNQIDAACPKTLVVGVISGTFSPGEMITGVNSGATAMFIGVGVGTISVLTMVGDLQVGEEVVGDTTGAFTAITAIPQNQIAENLEVYWNKVLAANCAANVVIAQVLAADALGRYVSATEGLARALEVYLDARAESTVKVAVVDGSINLLSVNVAVTLSLLPGFTAEAIRESIRSQAQSAIEAELLGRSYGASLRISDLYKLVEDINGVDWANISVVSINGGSPSGYINQFGDVVLQDYQVITLGDPVTVTLV